MAEIRLSLREHREALARNPNAFESDLLRVRQADAVVSNIKKAGFKRVTRNRCAALIDQFIDLIFSAQDRKPFFHTVSVSGLPFCWNAPGDWTKDYILYEWGHLQSRNQNHNAERLGNLCLQSARCNQHIQTSMDIDEVIEWTEGSKVAKRAKEVLRRREQLFQSPEWKSLIVGFERYR